MKKKTSCLVMSSILGGAGMLASPLALADCTDPSGATVTCSNSVTTPQYFRTDGQSVTVAQGTQFTTTGGMLLSILATIKQVC